MFCANCNRLLPYGQTICSICEPEIKALPAISWENDAPGTAPADQGFFECPACHKHFDDCVQIDVPPGSPWYQQALLSDACPYCKTMLEWAPIPATTRIQFVLDKLLHTLQPILLITYLWVGYQALFGTPPPDGWGKALVPALIFLPQLTIAFVPHRSLKLGHYQLKTWRPRRKYAIALSILAVASLLGAIALLIHASPSPWVTVIFYSLLGLNAVAGSSLLVLNLRQRRQAKARAAQMPTAP